MHRSTHAEAADVRHTPGSPITTGWVLAAIVAGLVSVTACGGGSQKTPPAETPAPATESASQAPAPAEDDTAGIEDALPEGARALLAKPFTGDFDQMVERRMIRVGVTFNRSFYFIEKGAQRGIAYQYGHLMEQELNKKLNTGNTRIHAVFVPVPRDMLLPGLVSGKIDLAVAQLTITPEKQKMVDFTIPTRRDVSEVVVTGPDGPAITSVEDLSGKRVYVRKSSSYYESLLALNERLGLAGKPPVFVQLATENLEDDDLLEMVNAGLIPVTIVDDYLARFWQKVFTSLVVHEDLTLRSGGMLGVAIRKNSPQLAARLNEFIGKYGIGSTFGNMMQKRYFATGTFVKNAAAEAERKKFLAVVAIFKKYAAQYDLDYLLMGAQGFQESQLNQAAKSKVGAVGIMQVMPATGKELKVGDIRKVDPNIHAGVKYFRFMMNQYDKDEPMDQLNKGLFTFASYNAGPARVRQLRQEAAKRGLDPNVWFGNVEQIASERIGRETVTYVSNIYKYYVAYRLITEEMQKKTAAKEALKQKVQ